MKTEEDLATMVGRALIEGERFIWETRTHEIIFQVPIKDIKVIGEYTTAGGPWEEDWFLVFVIGPDEFYSISADAIGMAKALEELSLQLGDEVTRQLIHSTTWYTHVLWPPELRGQSLFKATDKPPQTVWQRFKRLIGFGEVEIGLTDVIKESLE